MTPLDPATRELQRRLRFDTPFWAGGVTRGPDGEVRRPGPDGFQGCARIVSKAGALVPCIAHPWQITLDDLLEGQRAEGKPMRAIILKARKTGMSTWVAMKFLQRVTQLEYQLAIVCAQDTRTAGFILDMAKTAHANLPTEAQLGLGFNVKPKIIGRSESMNGRKFLQFGEPSIALREEGRTGASTFEIDTAGAPEGSRGLSPRLVHLSEVAWWEGEQASRKMLGLLNAVPNEPETIVVLESTANGLNHFHRRWVSARDGGADPDTGETYVALFMPWWRDPSCSMRFATAEDRLRFGESIGDESRYGEIAEDEKMLVELYALTLEQLYWRRSMIRTQHEGNVQLFKQEWPASDEEAFIGSGRTFFGSVLITKAIKAAEDAPKPVLGTLRPSGMEVRRSRAGTIEVPTGAVWVPSGEMRRGELGLWVWEHPRPAGELPPERALLAAPTAGSSEALLRAAELAAQDQAEADRPGGPGAYIVAADIAEGAADTFTDGDFHVVSVFDHHSHAQCAVHESRVDKAELPLFFLLIAMYYNQAWLGVEVNGPGIAVVDPLHKDYRYPRMYRRMKIDTTSRQEVRKPGWLTDQVSKPAMEATFSAALMQGTHGLRDVRTARQLSTYVVDDKGRRGALHGEHDDRLMAAMIAHRMMETIRPPRVGKVRHPRRPRDEITGY